MLFAISLMKIFKPATWMSLGAIDFGLIVDGAVTGKAWCTASRKVKHIIPA